MNLRDLFCRLHILFLVFIFAGDLYAQPDILERSYNHHKQLWTAFYINTDFNENWGAEVDIQHRRQNFEDDDDWGFMRAYQYQGYRTWLHFYPTDDFTISLSPFMYVHEIPLSVDSWFSDFEEQQEYRFSLRLEKEHEHRFFISSHRYSLEHRRLTTDEDPGFFWREWRTRYQFQITRELTKSIDLVFFNEVFLSFGSRVQYNVFDENRSHLGLEFDVGNHLSFELAYRYALDMQRSGSSFNSIHILYTSISISNLLGSR